MTTTATTTMATKWKCMVCGFEYDEALGMPEHGFPAGTRWEEIPDEWLCPDCGVSKSEFEMEVVA